MLDRALVKRLRDSDSDSEKEEKSLPSKKSSAGKPTDILTTDKPTNAQVHVTTHIQPVYSLFNDLMGFANMVLNKRILLCSSIIIPGCVLRPITLFTQVLDIWP